jgi:hypothetical protein
MTDHTPAPDVSGLSRCVRCSNWLDVDAQRCSNCGLTNPGDPASAGWVSADGYGFGVSGGYGGDLRDHLGHQG